MQILGSVRSLGLYSDCGSCALPSHYLNTVLYIFVFQIILPFCLIKCRIVLNALGSTNGLFLYDH